jgi:AGZA family xanthine/uracil permease-like MFS transporter
MMNLRQYFAFEAHQTHWGQEFRAGLTTFMSMAYILVVIPGMFHNALPEAPLQLLSATALAAATGCALMGLIARYPFALAPGLGLAAYVAFGLIEGLGMTLAEAMGLVTVSGALMLFLSLAGVRSLFIDALPEGIKSAIVAGIGGFLAFIGAKNAGIIMSHPSTLVTLGSLKNPTALLALGGTSLTLTLMHFRVRGAILFGIVSSCVIAILCQWPVYNGTPFAGFPQGIAQAPIWPSAMAGNISFAALGTPAGVNAVLTLTMVGLFDTAGTLLALGRLSGWSNLERLPHAFLSDAITTMTQALWGASNATVYVESAAGIEEGGRTGVTALVVAALFLISLIFWPLATAVPLAATSPALIIVGSLMMREWSLPKGGSILETFPPFLTFLAMPLTFSIANGIFLGITSHVILCIATGQTRKAHPLLYVVTLFWIVSQQIA